MKPIKYSATNMLALFIISALFPSPVLADSVVCSVIPIFPISNVTFSNISSSDVSISWYTDVSATSQVFYDTEVHQVEMEYAYSTELDPELKSTHKLLLTDLLPSTVYHFRIKSTAFFNEFFVASVSGDYALVTPSFENRDIAGGKNNISQTAPRSDLSLLKKVPLPWLILGIILASIVIGISMGVIVWQVINRRK